MILPLVGNSVISKPDYSANIVKCSAYFSGKS